MHNNLGIKDLVSSLQSNTLAEEAIEKIVYYADT
jgi:hypothetical protein